MTVGALEADRHEPEPVSAVLLSPESRALRRRLRPLAWMALEEVALDAVAEDGRLVARTSARRVANLLQVDPGSAARALRVLREHGLVVLEREKGPGGRFGLSVYVLRTVAGLTVLSRGAVEPHSALPCSDEADMGEPHAAVPCVEKPCTDGAYGATPAVVAHTASGPPGQVRVSPFAQDPPPPWADRTPTGAQLGVHAIQMPGQSALDFDEGIA
jgi:DNA-binding transcriptional ArsR family regulator